MRDPLGARGPLSERRLPSKRGPLSEGGQLSERGPLSAIQVSPPAHERGGDTLKGVQRGGDTEFSGALEFGQSESSYLFACGVASF